MHKDITTTAGIDTSKATLDIAVHGRSERWQVGSTLSGWRTLATDLADVGVGRIGIEATGGYERGVVGHLRAGGFTILVLQPIQVGAYARVRLRRAKNDALDAAPIAACTANLEPPAIEPDARLADLTQHLTFVEQLEEDIVRLKIRLERIDDWRLRRLFTNVIARLKERRNTELRRIASRLRADSDLARRLDLVVSIPGIGERTVIAVIVRLPELGRLSRELAWPHWPASRRSTTTVEHTRENAISPADTPGCAAPCLLPPCRPPSAGTSR